MGKCVVFCAAQFDALAAPIAPDDYLLAADGGLRHLNRLKLEAYLTEHTEFYAGDMKDILTDDFVAANGRPDVMIVDPPRAGMHEDVVNVILNSEPERIVYVSCNPATQARDLAMLDVKYRVMEVQPVDMFPHTHHVENVVALELRK